MSVDEGREERDEGAERARQNRPVESMRVRLRLLRTIRDSGSMTSDDATDDATAHRGPYVGGAVLAISTNRLIRKNGEQRQTIRKLAHARPLPVWVAVDPQTLAAEIARLEAILEPKPPPPGPPPAHHPPPRTLFD